MMDPSFLNAFISVVCERFERRNANLLCDRRSMMAILFILLYNENVKKKDVTATCQ